MLFRLLSAGVSATCKLQGGKEHGIVMVAGRSTAQVVGSATPSVPRERSSTVPQFWGSPVFMPTPFNAERPNSAR